MADSYQDFHVNGPTVIKWGASTASTELGMTDNEDLIRIVGRDHYRTFTRNDTGDMIAEAVYAGTSWTIDFTMVSWNQTQLEALLGRVRSGAGGGDEGTMANVGGTLFDGRAIALSIEGTNDGSMTYTFATVMLASGPEYIDFGNTVKRIALSFVSVFSGTDSTPPSFTAKLPA
jgi:hypothetical protein